MKSNNYSINNSNIISKMCALTIVVLLMAQAAISQEIHIEGFASNTAEKNYPNIGIPLLQDFYFRFSSGDRHIQAISVVPNDPLNKIKLEYFDDTHNDEFYYKITHRDFATLSGVITDSKVFFLNGRESQILNKPGANYELILIGFELYYHGGDHHIDEIGIFEEERTGRSLLTVAFNDKNNDDLAVGIVYYAWLPSSYIVQTGVSTQSGVRGGSSQEIPRGIRLIKGFKFDFANEDHHINEVGILTTTSLDGNLNVLYSDKNRDDIFNWTVNWAILKDPINPFEPLAVSLTALHNAKFLETDERTENNDISSIDEILHEDFVYYSSSKLKLSKKDFLEGLKNGEIRYNFKDEGTQIRQIGNTAVISGEVELDSNDKSKINNNKNHDKYFYISNLIYEDNKWLFTRMHFISSRNTTSSHQH